MKKLSCNKSGFALLNVVIGLVIISITIVVALNFNSYLLKEEQMTKEDFNFYLGLNNLVEEIYSLNWQEDSKDFISSLPQEIPINKGEAIKVQYDGPKEDTTFNTLRLEIKIIPPNENGTLVYNLEKAIKN